MSLIFETLIGRVEIPREVVKEVISIELTNCFHWRCPNTGIDYSDVMEFLEGSRDLGLLKKIARYILVYTENLVLSTYMYMKMQNPRAANEYLDTMKLVLHKLRNLYQLLQRKPHDIYHELVEQMLHTCLDNGIDPF